uniref:Small EDRK-rich factor-like N-terminal domain-containing protein n=1 Tax=Oryza punctata TaxID=4537 RepID=A0A0E0L2F7_ORYPU
MEEIANVDPIERPPYKASVLTGQHTILRATRDATARRRPGFFQASSGIASRARWNGRCQPPAGGCARGDQRARDRQRAQARKPVVKGRDDGLTPEQRRERDAKALQEKAARKAAQATGQGGNGSGAKGKSGGKSNNMEKEIVKSPYVFLPSTS